MSDLRADPLMNVVHHGIKGPIRLLLEHDFFEAGLKLVFAGIDAMAFLGLPDGAVEVTGADFIAWCDNYLHLPGSEPVSSLELYGARCGLLHCHSGESRSRRQGTARLIQWTNKGVPVLYRPDIDANLVFVSVQALVESFFEAVDRFLVELFREPGRAAVADARLQNMFVYRRQDEIRAAT
ncbi:MAG: hypothetical protein EPN53_02880 [Acidobacteria bacterium]|nr:MAG: hypothetical protein EPN53_02880 [Acidobacteriota bacterium]